MSVVKINAIRVPDGMGPELEKRFAERARSVEQMPGFEAFELLRPTAGEERYFVYTRWDSEESFQNWVNSQQFQHGHARAQSADGKLQVELAQLQYRLPRLSQRDEGLSRLAGGIGGSGPGEGAKAFVGADDLELVDALAAVGGGEGDEGGAVGLEERVGVGRGGGRVSCSTRR